MSSSAGSAYRSWSKQAISLACVLLCVAALSGCSVLDVIKNAFSPGVPKVDIGEIQVLTDPEANLNTAVQFALVFVKDPDLLKKLSDLSAAKWFEMRDELRKTYPEGFESREWELVPGQDLRLRSGAFNDERALAVFVYANYLTPGPHRARIDSFRQGVTIRLLRRGLTVTARSDTERVQ